MNTLSKALTFKAIKQAMKQQGHAFFETGDNNLNLVGIRASDLNSNAFNDVLAVLYYQNGRETMHLFDCTTDPGLFWRENPAHTAGTAIMKPGQYRGLWHIGTHRGQYFALKQKCAADFYRDNNRDETLNLNGPVHNAIIGANCHRASAVNKSTQVNKWSAGCQVLANPNDFNLLMALCEIARHQYGNSFSYTLLNEADIKTKKAKAA